MVGREPRSDPRRTSFRGAVRDLHGLLLVLAVHPHRSGRDRHVGARPRRDAVRCAGPSRRSRAHGIRRARQLSDARRRVLHGLRAPPTNMSDLRLSGIPCDRSGTGGVQGADHTPGPQVGLHRSRGRRSRATRRRAGLGPVPRRDEQRPGAPVPRSPTQPTALALELHHEFLTCDPLTGEERAVRPGTEVIRVALAHLTAQR